MEVWKKIKGFEKLYEVSNLGRVRRLDTIVVDKNNMKKHIKGKILNSQQYSNGYLFYCLSKNGLRKGFLAHRLVALAFIKNPENKKEVNHINEDKTDNRVKNLQWMTHKENINHGTAIERRVKNSNFKGKNNPMYGRKGSLNSRSKPVQQFTLNNVLVKEYSSLACVGRETGFNKCAIRANINGRTSQSAGYKWKYKNTNF